jgi:hypothetical protein
VAGLRPRTEHAGVEQLVFEKICIKLHFQLEDLQLFESYQVQVQIDRCHQGARAVQAYQGLLRASVRDTGFRLRLFLSDKILFLFFLQCFSGISLKKIFVLLGILSGRTEFNVIALIEISFINL